MALTTAFIIKPFWLSKILAGEKKWELRRSRSGAKHVGKEIGLAPPGTMRIWGKARLNAVTKYTLDELASFEHMHRVPRDTLQAYARGAGLANSSESTGAGKRGMNYLYAFELSCVTLVSPPVWYPSKPGAVTFVTFDARTVNAAQEGARDAVSLEREMVQAAQSRTSWVNRTVSRTAHRRVRR